jgi:hypothetical protein
MRISINANRGFYFAFIAILMVSILLFPITHSGDGWGYAADTLEFEGDFKSMLSPHHLLYMPWCSLWLPLIKFLHIDPIAGFTVLNLGLCVLTLEVLRTWLLKLNTTQSNAQWLIWLLLGSFGILRFAIDNETYIAPLFLAIFGSYLIENKLQRVASAGWVSLAFAVLFHQSYIFWFIAFALAAMKKGKWVAPILSGGLILFAYMLAAYASNESIFNFILHDVNQGLVETRIGLYNFLFTAVNLVRTIFQIHGFILFLIVAWPLLSIIGLVGLLLLAISSLAFVWRYISNRKKQTTTIRIFSGTLSWVFYLHLGFAFYSVGNAEFMTMLLPVATLLMAKARLFSFDDKTTKPLMGMAIGTWVYHMVFVLIPMFLGSNSDVERIAEILNKKIPSNNTQKIVLISNDAKAIENAWEYQARMNGNEPPKNIIFNLGSSEKDIQEIKILSKDSQVQILTHNIYIVSPIHSRASAMRNPITLHWIESQQWDPWQTTYIESPRREISLERLRK